MSIIRISMKQNPPPALRARLRGERVVAVHKARGGVECNRPCDACDGWIYRNQQIAITSCLRVIHAGCWVDTEEAA